ncbi:MAG: polysaccharide biosynthesis tyrosine autokinase [Kiritimatiellia bacterium]|jgi:capsular exopolysaccharide synthesis family protein|nr:polysaccharide biosynthesis tyrosine autokinase [Kiritimatiellia bacterium]MDP6847309.1 polysaccharide biosynthesis tyrosine autokinase [Kiritimatiellia bacterium]
MELLKILEVVRRRLVAIILVFLLFFGALAFWASVTPAIFEGKAKLLVESSDTLDSLMSSLGMQSMGGGSSSSEDYETDIALATLRPLLTKLIDQLELKNRKGEAIATKDLANAGITAKVIYHPYVEVDQYEESAILEITAGSTNATEAAKMANLLAELYVNDRLQRTREEYKAARLFIEEQLKSVKEQYYSSLADLSKFQTEESSLDLKLEITTLVQKIASLKSDLEASQQSSAVLQSDIDESGLKLAGMEKYRKESERAARSDEIRALKTELNELLVSLSKKATEVTKEHPDYKQIEREIETVRDLVKTEATMVLDNQTTTVDPTYDELIRKKINGEIDLAAAKSKQQLIESFIDSYQKRLIEIPSINAQHAKLDLELRVSQDMYQSLLEYMTQVGIAESMTVPDVRLVESAEEPDEQDFPKKVLVYIIGIFVGAFWAAAVAFVLEYIDHTVKTTSDLSAIEGLTVLGTIPKKSLLRRNRRISGLPPASPLVEAFRTVRSSIQYASVDEPVQVLAITSSLAKEGKSSVCANVATIYAMEGKKTIMVDLDLRRPIGHKYFGTPPGAGLTNVLVDGSSLEDVIISTDTEGLDFIASGPVPPDPSRLVESQKIKDVVARLREMYEVIVLDTPPVVSVNDALQIGEIADGMILVVEAAKTSFALVNHSKERLDQARVRIIGAILNKLRSQDHPYYHEYHHRYY